MLRSLLVNCVSCQWHGDDPSSRVALESFEFWGQRGAHIAHELTCPECGDDVEETVACADCGQRPADHGSDRCTSCDVQLAVEEAADELAAQKRVAELRGTLVSIALTSWSEAI